MNRTKPAVKQWTSQQYASACVVVFLIAANLIIVVAMHGNPDGAAWMILAFFLGATCASYGARSRDKAEGAHQKVVARTRQMEQFDTHE